MLSTPKTDAYQVRCCDGSCKIIMVEDFDRHFIHRLSKVCLMQPNKLPIPTAIRPTAWTYFCLLSSTSCFCKSVRKPSLLPPWNSNWEANSVQIVWIMHRFIFDETRSKIFWDILIIAYENNSNHLSRILMYFTVHIIAKTKLCDYYSEKLSFPYTSCLFLMIICWEELTLFHLMKKRVKQNIAIEDWW